ncbi:MAG: adenylate kinase [Bacilli bacterium]|nr:adenylate kinase [Bacilli bacterium]
MIIIITGTTHTGKTLLSQKLLEKYKYPYMSLDHLKMGLIRGHITNISVYDDDKLTEYMWPIVEGIIKTAIENKQNLIIEGCYIPINWKSSFNKEYLEDIKFICLAYDKEYITKNFSKIVKYGDIIEKRISNDLVLDDLIKDNQRYIEKFSDDILMIKDNYEETINDFINQFECKE